MPSFLRHSVFGGMRPSKAPHLLQPPLAQEAHNVSLRDGRLCPLGSPVVVEPGPLGSVWTVPSYADPGSATYLTFSNAETYVVPLYTHTNPGLMDVAVFRAGSPPIRRSPAGVTWPLVPVAPTTPPAVVDVTPAGVSPPSDLIGPDARAYVYTWIYEHGVESRPSQPVVVRDTFDGAWWQVTFSPAPAGVLGVRLYRMTYSGNATGDDPRELINTSYHLVTELPASAITYVDQARQSELEFGEMLRTADCDPPDMEQVFVLENGVLVGWSDNRVFFSEHGEPWNWPSIYRFEVNHRIVGMAVTANSAFIGTDGRAYRFDVARVAPDSDVSASISVYEYPEPMPIEHRHQIAAFPWGAVLAGPFSLVQMTESSLIQLTKRHMPEEVWRTEFRPKVLAYHGGRIYGTQLYGREGGWSIDTEHDGHVRLDAFVTLDLDAEWIHSGLDGRMYYVDRASGDVLVWDADPTSPMTYRWLSRAQRMRGRTKFAAAKIDGDFALGGVTMRILADGAVYDTHTATAPETWRLPVAPRGTMWEIELEGSACVSEVHVAQSRYELIQVPPETVTA